MKKSWDWQGVAGEDWGESLGEGILPVLDENEGEDHGAVGSGVRGGGWSRWW